SGSTEKRAPESGIRKVPQYVIRSMRRLPNGEEWDRSAPSAIREIPGMVPPQPISVPLGWNAVPPEAQVAPRRCQSSRILVADHPPRGHSSISVRETGRREGVRSGGDMATSHRTPVTPSGKRVSKIFDTGDR